MSLKIEWQEKECFGYTDEIPEWMLASEGLWYDVSHDVVGPKGGGYLAQCNVKTNGRVVVLDYRPYEKNKKEFYLGALRLTFGDKERVGEPNVAWRDESSSLFEKFKARVTRSQAQESPGPIPEEEIGRASEPFNPSNFEDARKHVIASLAARQGQQKFRNTLKAAYRSTCAMTGCSVSQVLEAAHIMGYRGKHTNHIQNGLLLRADIHTLFDLGLIGIDPSTWTIVLHRCMQDGPYRGLHGSTPHLPQEEANRPHVKALKHHLGLFGLKK